MVDVTEDSTPPVESTDSKQVLSDGPPLDHVPKPKTVQRRVQASEEAAQGTQAVMKKICALIESRDPGDMNPSLTQSFGARWLMPPVIHSGNTPGNGSVPTEKNWASALRFVEQLSHWSQSFLEVEDCLIKHAHFKLATDGQSAWADAHLWVKGLDRQGAPLDVRANLELAFEGPDWQLHALESRDGEYSWAPHPMFQDVSAQVGIHQFRSSLTDTTILSAIDAARIDTLVGLGVIDWNEDGRDDLMSWVRGRTLQIYVNDGRGAFDPILNPIPPKHVGLSMLYLDLDKNGRMNLISSQVAGCEKGIAWLALYEKTDSGFRDLGRALSFESDCHQFQDIRFQHLEVSDVDADGDLDVFAAGFQRINPGEGAHQRQNVFRAVKGLPNLLFRNDGSMRFTDMARPHGFGGHSFSYGAVFTDLTGDGRPDLYVVNDYGPNQAYENLGDAKFRALSIPPLTENGQSMGITVSDLNDDGRWDLYVSNMYSHAGNRILPLMRQQFSQHDYQGLLKLAAGNTLYTPKPDGGFQDAAPELQLAHAGWAWGQAVFDVDNDSDWDVYVVSGNTSNRDARAPDY